MRFQSYFNTAIKIISEYDGSLPLAHFLKKYFSENKKHGSTDRKYISHACYNFYRLGFAVKDVNTDERLKVAIFLCNDVAGGWSVLYDDDWIEHWNETLRKRIYFIQLRYQFLIDDIFPFANELSSDVDRENFILSHLIQPNVFLRIRNHHHEKVFNELHHHHIVFEKINDDCIALQPSTKIETIIKIDKEAVIQDYSSQRVKEFLSAFKAETGNAKSEIAVWDCCAGSGGKSMLAYDTLSNIKLTVSDIRASIIQNLKQRFQNAGIKNYKAFVTDISNSKPEIINTKFDLIICDAPCTGSGTWSRTPEQLYFFQPEKIEYYSHLQKKIVSNAIDQLKNDGYFLYITCSVFTEEDDAIISFIQNTFNLHLIHQEILKGYNMKADTMFAALFKK